MIGNKTCVLSKCGALDKNLGINLQHFTVDMWNMMDASEQPEPEFKARMVEGMEMCYKFSQSIPQDILAAKGPMYEMFGRQMKFLMCKKVVMKECCVKQEWKKWRSLPRNMSSNSFSACNFSETQKTFIVTKHSHEPMLSKSYRSIWQ